MSIQTGMHIFYANNNKKTGIDFKQKYRKPNNWYKIISFPAKLPDDKVLHCSPTVSAFHDQLHVFYMDSSHVATMLVISSYTTKLIKYSTQSLSFEVGEAIAPYFNEETLYLFYKSNNNNSINYRVYTYANGSWFGGFGNTFQNMSTGNAPSFVSGGVSPYLWWSSTDGYLYYASLNISNNGNITTSLVTNTNKKITYSPSAVFCNIYGYSPFYLVFYQAGEYTRSLRCYHFNSGSGNQLRKNGEYSINNNVPGIYTSPSAVSSSDGYVYICYEANSGIGKSVNIVKMDPKTLDAKSTDETYAYMARANSSPCLLIV
ncbi:hypothetical protein PHO31112_04416 [Pandoraea horticolens]|uniref:Uncharacterized protein n=1 Tax=Pandoraea horticolens TaxID=2508298 RepID=A0A5E4YCL1_9BURK|nr:hypothetical protein [Pandoraea horticolens]VVE46128.1 hypothetical protein PHO31112_04416 [Pandoraea horticolens]